MKKYIFFALISLGLLLRVFELGIRPSGFTWDEAAIGYNAYSLLQTGRDEYGQAFPIVFKSFGDYKPGLYIHLAVPAIKIFGLNEFATRLPSAIFGTLLLVVIFVLSRLLFPKSLSISYYSLLIASTNPWLIQFSRGTWEANLNLLLTTLAVTVFVFNINRKSLFLNLIAFGFFGLTFWSYQSAKLFTPLLILSLVFIYLRHLSLKKLIIPLLLLLLLLLPILVGLASQSGRLKVFSVFSYTRRESDVVEILRQDNTKNKNFTYFIFHSELLDQSRGILQRYLNHLSPRFLFSEGDWTSLRHSVYRHGYFYLIEFIPLCLGGFFLLSKLKAKSYQLIAMWMFFAPLPAALSRDLVSGVRSLALSIPIILIIALGLSHLFSHKSIFKPLFSMFYLLFSTYFLVYYLDFYYLHQPYYSAREWVSPYKYVIQAVSENYDKYSNVFITDKLGQPYIFTLFYLRYDPEKYQKEAHLNQDASGDVGQIESFDKFKFGPVFWPQLRGRSSALTVGDEYELPEKDLVIPGLVRIADVSYPDGQLGLRVVANP